MTVRIPKWLLFAVAGLVVVATVGVGAYWLGKSSDDDGDGGTAEPTTTAEAVTQPPCSKAEAERAVQNTEFESQVRDAMTIPRGEPLLMPPWFVINKLTCRDLTGDGVEEMIVQLACCTASTPTPWAIFAGESGEWKLAFDRQRISSVLSVEGDEIVEKQPAYGADDPLCCPATFRFARVSWDGDEFVASSDDASPDRRIKVGTQGVARLGDFRPESGSPFDAAEAFGPRSFITPDDELCVQEWRDLGLVVNFANLGGADPCTDEGAVGSFDLQGSLAAQAGWETTEGVKVGMSLDELREIYPDAQSESIAGLGEVLVLIEGPTLIGEGGTYPVLSARSEKGEVSELQLSVGAAGD